MYKQARATTQRETQQKETNVPHDDFNDDEEGLDEVAERVYVADELVDREASFGTGVSCRRICDQVFEFRVKMALSDVFSGALG